MIDEEGFKRLQRRASTFKLVERVIIAVGLIGFLFYIGFFVSQKAEVFNTGACELCEQKTGRVCSSQLTPQQEAEGKVFFPSLLIENKGVKKNE